MSGLVGDGREEAFDLVKPGFVGRDEVHVPARPSRQPGLDLGVVVGGVVAGDAADIQFGGYGLVDLAQEGRQFRGPKARLARSRHRAGEHLERCEQRRRAVAPVVMGRTFERDQAHGLRSQDAAVACTVGARSEPDRRLAAVTEGSPVQARKQADA